ncbi:flagellar motor protein MotB [Paenibacillus gallinarum]|uniref:OmpA family protein n=1 Tax=Paenibacillus gallinarum TaxID=2762232 RepID=A0ABR8SZG8_9BACL|nr:flagellar motor protein MotB [Paenibacillus gallinarum]MBD7968911.1 OmpA family protein [Paenibacillus gallinarum]
MRQRNRRSRLIRTRQARASNSAASHDRWMITYADLITLLLIFFIMLYAMSRLDANKYEDITSSLQTTFQNSNHILEGNEGITGDKPSPEQQNPGGDAMQSDDNKNENPESEKTESAHEAAFRAQEKELQQLLSQIEGYIEDHNLTELIFVEDKPQGISITLSERFLFRSGNARLMDGSSPVLHQLASLFRDLGMNISIEGHTDNMPIVNSSTYKDNWELSGARALSVLRYFMDEEDLESDHFQYAGYADTRPAEDNSTKEGRQKNRRVEITVLRQLQE